MDSGYSTEVSQLFTKGAHHCKVSLVLITQNIFHQVPSSRDISLNSKYIVVFKNPRDKTQIVRLARQVYHKNIYSFRNTYLDVCQDSHSYLFLDFTQSRVYSDLEQRYFLGKIQMFLRLLKVMNRLKSQLHFLHVLNDAKPKAKRVTHICK